MSGKKRGRPFESGNPGGPGAPKVPDDIKAARKLTQIELERVVNKYLYAEKSEIQKATADPKTTVLELLIASIIHKGVIEGDERRLNFLLDRLVGKVKDQIVHSGTLLTGNVRVFKARLGGEDNDESRDAVAGPVHTDAGAKGTDKGTA